MGAIEELIGALTALPAEERAQVERESIAATKDQLWIPNVGPQTDAFFCEADDLFYGGQAGGGKSDLLIGLALTAHTNSLLLRRLNDDVKDLAERCRAVAGPDHSYNGQDHVLRVGGRRLKFGGCQLERDKERYKGRARDLYGFDEIGDFTFGQFKFITAWNRSAGPGQRCRVVCAGNPPTRPEGLWVTKFWAAWLDKNHPRPARPGELRWYVRGPDDEDVEVEGRGPHSFDWAKKPVFGRSRTFIPSSLDDNPDYATSESYRATLDNLDVNLQRAYRDGDFTVGISDDDWQVIPTAWIEAAMQRWQDKVPARIAMTAMAVDVAPGGGDQRVIGWRYGAWVGRLDAKREVDKTGRNTAADVVRYRRDRCPVVVDLGGGWGGTALVALKDNGIEAVPFNGVESTTRRSRCGKYSFRNKRAWSVWTVREELDPSQEGGSAMALPPDPELKADLASYRYDLTSGGVLLEPKEKQKDRIGRSPDKGDTVAMLVSEGSRAAARALHRQQQGERPSQANVGYASMKARR